MNGEIFVVDVKFRHIMKFGKSGDFIKIIGRKGQGPGEFMNPLCFCVTDKYIIVNDSNNYNIQFFDFDGKFIKSFKVFKAYIEIVANSENIYATPLVLNKSSHLVDVLNMNGELQTSIIKPYFDYQNFFQMANMIRIDINNKGELVVAFRHFPLILKYSPKGERLEEWKLDYDILKIKEENNHKWLLNKEGPGLMPIFFGFRASETGYYLLLNYPLTQILELNLKGELINDYLLPDSNNFLASDFLESKTERNGTLRQVFHIVIRNPQAIIQVLRPGAKN
jgi:hypothetical protein